MREVGVVEGKHIPKYEEHFQRSIWIVIFVLTVLLSMGALLAIIWNIPLGLENRLVIP